MTRNRGGSSDALCVDVERDLDTQFAAARVMPDRGEVATVAGAYLGFQRYYNPDDLVGRKGLAVYDLMMLDAQVKACVAIKKAAVLGRGWDLHPGSKSGGAKPEVLEFCRWALQRMEGSFVRRLGAVCDALVKGYSITEAVWTVVPSGKYAGRVYVQKLKAKDPAEFDFEVDDKLNVLSLYHYPTSTSLPLRRFVTYSHNSQYENPYGTSDLRAAYRNYWCKDFLTRYMNVYLEKYGAPTLKGSYRRGTPADAQNALLKTLERVQKESAIIVPDDMVVELLETVRQGESGYRLAIEHHNKEISKGILGNTLVSDDGGSGIGSFALAKVHLDVLRMCLAGLKVDLEEQVVTEQILRPLVEYNYGPEEAVPVFSLGPLEAREIGPLSVAMKALVEAGIVDPTDPALKEFLGLAGFADGPGRDMVPSVQRTRSEAGGPGDGNNATVGVG